MTLPKDFCHLQVHSERSLLDATVRIPDLCKQSAELGMTAVALTDMGNFYGAVEFYREAKKAGVKPIFGCEVNVAARTHKDKEPYLDKKTTRLVLLAQNQKGYQNLIKLISRSHLEGFYYRPRVDLDLLATYSEGIFCLSGGLNGHIPAAILQRQPDELVLQKVQALKDIYGKHFYLQINHHQIPDQNLWVAKVIELSKKLRLPLVLTNDVYYLKQEDAEAYDALVCIGAGKLLSDPMRFRLMSDQYYLKSPAEMAKLFPDLPEAYENTLKISDHCVVDLNLNVTLLPRFEVPKGENEASYLNKLAAEGLGRRYNPVTPALQDRLHYELSVIEKMGYAAYFLIVHDFIQWAKGRDIPVGPGRGSAAGSLVAYALGITDIDPLRYHLLFERFLNPDRVSMPDIDVDFCIRRRQEVLDYVAKKYGSDHVAQIITFGTMASRAAIRDVGRVMDVPLALVDKVAKLIPVHQGKPMELATARQDVPELKEILAADKSIAKLFDLAEKLEGLSRHAGTHAAGVVISKDPLDDIVPRSISRSDNEHQIVTQFPMGDLEAIGLLKMDFLGLRNLTMMGETLTLIKRNHNKEIDLTRILLDDAETYKLLQSGRSVGIFQLESSGMQQLMVDLKPENFEDIVALLALYRPGPLGSGMVSEFISNKHGRTAAHYLLPELQPVLKETHGLILYQEQVMQIASVIAGFTLGQADMMRRAMGKKKKEEMAKLEKNFIDGAMSKGFQAQKAKTIFELCAKFAEYGFNKSHSAAYAMISYQTAYLKTNYPLEYMAALLTSTLGSMDRVTTYINECRELDIDILSPDINESWVDFSVENGSIRFGLGAIKNVGQAVIETILRVRSEKGAFQSLADFCRKVDLRVVNKRVLESLVKAGCFDVFGRRAQLMAVLDDTVEHAVRDAKEKATGQASLFELMSGSAAQTEHWHNQLLPDVPDWDLKQKLKYEKELLGLYISGHPLEHIKDMLQKQTNATTQSLENLNDGAKLVIGGIIQNTRKVITRSSQKPMLFATLEDMQGSVELVVFPGKAYDTCSDFIRDDGCVIVEGILKKEAANPKVLVDAVRIFDLPGQTINIELGSEDVIRLNDIHILMLEHRGQNPVVFHYNGQKIQSGQAHWVSSDEIFISKLEALIGHGKVWAA